MNIDKIVDKVIKAEQDKNGPLYLTPTVQRLLFNTARAGFEQGRHEAISEEYYRTHNKLDVTWEQE